MAPTGTVTLIKGSRSKLFRLYERESGANKLHMQNVKEVFGLVTIEFAGVNEASDTDGYSVSAFEPGAVIVVSGEPSPAPALQPAAPAPGNLPPYIRPKPSQVKSTPCALPVWECADV